MKYLNIDAKELELNGVILLRKRSPANRKCG